MARFEYAVFVPAFLFSVLLSPFYPTNAANLEDSTTTASKTGLPTGLTHRNGDVEDMEASLAVNQLAILHILTGESSGSECERTPEVEGLSEVLDNLRSIKENLVVLRESQATFQWRQSELREGLTEVKESLTQMSVIMGDLKENHNILHNTITTQNTSLNRLEIYVSVQNDSLDTITDQLGSLDGHVGNITYHIDTLDSHVETVHNITIIQNITVTTMMEDIQTLQDNDKVFQNFTKHLREEFDGHVENFKWKQDAGSLFHHEGHRFFVNNDTLNWTDSRQWCQARGGDLAQPTGNLTMFLQEVLRHAPPATSSDQGVWLGASDEVEEGEWKWLSGSSIPSDFPWGSDQPNSGTSQNCLEIWYQGEDRREYNDRGCTKLKYSVCQM